jgi:hypothetical protein
MSTFRWIAKVATGLLAMAAATLLASMSAPAAARADDPVTPDPTIMDVLDSVLADNGGPAPVPSTPAPQPTSPRAPGGPR